MRVGRKLWAQIVLPNVNTNPENQPNIVRGNQLNETQREYALTAFMAKDNLSQQSSPSRFLFGDGECHEDRWSPIG